MKKVKILNLLVLGICVMGLSACSGKPKNPMSILPASALSLIQLDAQKNPNMTNKSNGIEETSALALAMKRVQKEKGISQEDLESNTDKTLVVNTDKDELFKISSDVQNLKRENWTIEGVFVGPVENITDNKNPNLAINSILNAHEFIKNIRKDTPDVNIQYKEYLPLKTISIEMKKDVQSNLGDIPDA